MKIISIIISALLLFSCASQREMSLTDLDIADEKTFPMIDQYTYDVTLNQNVENRYKFITSFLDKRIHKKVNILDIGHRNPLTERLEKYGKLFNTAGDLDTDFTFPKQHYNYCIASAVLYKLFCPINFMIEVQAYCDTLIIIDGQRPCTQANECNWHEIDSERMLILFKRTGYTLVEKYCEDAPGYVNTKWCAWVLEHE